MATQKFTNFDNFLKMYADMTAVTIQSNTIVSNEVKDATRSLMLLESSYGKTELFPNPVYPYIIL